VRNAKVMKKRATTTFLVFFAPIPNPFIPPSEKSVNMTRDMPREITSATPEGSEKEGDETSRFLLGYLEK
jgi:hypothetical protein